jgi:hypothetical protein
MPSYYSIFESTDKLALPKKTLGTQHLTSNRTMGQAEFRKVITKSVTFLKSNFQLCYSLTNDTRAVVECIEGQMRNSDYLNNCASVRHSTTFPNKIK